MNYDELLLGAINTAKTLGSSAIVKSIVAGILTIVFHRHAILFYAFTMLVFIDLLTRWVAIGCSYLIAKHNEDEKLRYPDMTLEAWVPTFWECVRAIKPAREAGMISSDVMKHRFLGKIFIYLICAMSAASVDLCMLTFGKPSWAVECIIGYLVITELLSIIENLNAAGVEAVQGLLDILKKKKG